MRPGPGPKTEVLRNHQHVEAKNTRNASLETRNLNQSIFEAKRTSVDEKTHTKLLTNKMSFEAINQILKFEVIKN